MLLLKFVSAAALLTVSAFGWAQQPVPYPTPDNPWGDTFTTTYVRLGPDTEGLLVQPVNPNPRADIAMVFSHPNSDNFGERPGWYMAERGYPVMLINNRGNTMSDDMYLPHISLGIGYMRQLEGIDKVVLLSHSGGTHVGALYQNVAENGPEACQGAEKLYPCTAQGLDQLEPADGVVFLDPTLGAAHQATAVDPAITRNGRNPSLDMFTARNGFNADGDSDYSPEFAARFYQAQSKRNNQLIDDALKGLKALEEGKGDFSNDSPLIIRGIGLGGTGARLYQPDTSFQSHTRVPHLLLKADGSEENAIIRSVRNPANHHPGRLNTLGTMNAETSVREFLSSMAVRTTDDYAMTEDDITGVDWDSAISATPGNAKGITVPTLVLAMGCHYLIVPGEVVYNNLASEDKFYAAVEGAEHGFYPCREEYGDTVSRTFDFVDRWTSEAGRF